MKISLLLILSLIMTAGLSQTAAAAPASQSSDRMDWWRDARFGMFIHWGVYSVPAGEWDGRVVPGVSEWIMQTAKIPVSRYEPLAKDFTAEHYDPQAWAKAAKDAGMRYVVITSKHHDGFCLWDSPRTDWDVTRTPHGKDLLAPLAEAVRAEGLKFGLYHSIMDWHHPDYAPRRDWHDTAEGEPDFDAYRAYLTGQVEEIIERFDPAILWFDGEWESTWTQAHGQALENRIRELRPNIIINNRIGKARQGMAGLNDEDALPLGDFGTPEQEIPSTGLPGVDWESCMTFNDSWGYKTSDANWKSPTTIVRNLIDCASKGGNYLLNVGPTADGRIPQESLDRLKEVGDWMDMNGEAIYGTQAGPFERLSWGKATRRGNTLFLFVFDWPEDGRLTVPLRTGISKATALADPEASIGVTQSGEGQRLDLSGVKQGPHATAIAIVLAGEPDVLPTLDAEQAADGSLTLPASTARTTHGLRLESIDGRRSLGYWTNAAASAEWLVSVEHPGRFDVTLELACQPESAGSTVEVLVDDAPVARFTVEDTGGWHDFREVRLEATNLPSAGPVRIRMQAVEKAGLGVMNLREVRLTPTAG